MQKRRERLARPRGRRDQGVAAAANRRPARTLRGCRLVRDVVGPPLLEYRMEGFRRHAVLKVTFAFSCIKRLQRRAGAIALRALGGGGGNQCRELGDEDTSGSTSGRGPCRRIKPHMP